MFNKVHVPVLGVIENMSIHICSQCGHAEPIFGEGGGQQIAEQYGIPLLGSLPLDSQIRQQTDSGKPTMVAEPHGANAKSYSEIAQKIVTNLSLQAKTDATRFPKIVIQND